FIVVWIHGCIGIRAWLRPKPWYPRAAAPLAVLATLVPVLAMVGFTNAGLNMRDAVKREPGVAARYLTGPPGTQAEQDHASLMRVIDAISLTYLALLAGTFGLRMLRDWHARRYQSVRITYPGGRVVTVPSGFSVLEASRWGGIPHASVCGGRGRCSTCRVRVLRGLPGLPQPAPVESATLARIGAPQGVRLACQIRPKVDVTVQTLVPAGRLAHGLRLDVQEGRELTVTALSVDLRDSTRLAAGRLPFDVVFIVDRYI